MADDKWPMTDDRCEKTGGKTPHSLFPIRHQPSVISHFLAISFPDGLSAKVP